MRKHLPNTCQVCHCDGKHRPTGTLVVQEPLIKQDWIEVYYLTQFYLGRLHDIVAKARSRKESHESC